MTPLVQFCVVVVTVALVVNTIVAIRAMKRAEDALARTTAAIDHIEVVTRQMQELVASIQTAIQPVLRTTMRIEEVAERATRASHAVLDEIDPPLRTTLAVLAGVKQGTRSWIGALARRMSGSETRRRISQTSRKLGSRVQAGVNRVRGHLFGLKNDGQTAVNSGRESTP